MIMKKAVFRGTSIDKYPSKGKHCSNIAEEAIN